MAIMFNQEAAMGADKGGYIQNGGYYKGKFTGSKIVSGKEKAKFVEFSFEADSGEQCNYLRVNTTKKDGERSFGFGKIMALMGIFDLKSIEPVGMENEIPELCNRFVGITIQREDYKKKDGKIGWQMNLLHFHDYQTNKTYSELREGKEAKTYLRKIEDKLMASDGTNIEVPEIGTDDDDLPF